MVGHKFTINQVVSVIVVIWIMKEQEAEDESPNIDDISEVCKNLFV